MVFFIHPICSVVGGTEGKSFDGEESETMDNLLTFFHKFLMFRLMVRKRINSSYVGCKIDEIWM